MRIDRRLGLEVTTQISNRLIAGKEKPVSFTKMDWYIFLPVGLLVVALTGVGLHRMVRHLGAKGLSEYVPIAPTKKSVGGAMMNFQALFEPAIEHVIEYQRSGDLTIQTT